MLTCLASGNRFQQVLEDESLENAGGAFDGVTELALEDTLLDWSEICHIAAKFPSLTTLHAGSNHFSTLTPIPPAPFTSTLVSLHLEYNVFTSLTDLAPLTCIPTLRSLLLKGNHISTITPDITTPPPTFTANLHHLDLSYNTITSWSFIDALPDSLPGLTSLRLTHNPLYSDPDLDTTTASSSTATTHPKPPIASNTTTTATGGGISKSDEAYMLTLARLPLLKALNFSAVTAADRADAEMFYLSRVARQLGAVPEEEEAEVLRGHRRWAELCEVYGRPAVVRQKGGEVDGRFLEGRVVTVGFCFEGTERVIKVPKSFDIYAVKGLVGRVFRVAPLGVRLVWETGEWDPVGGFDEGGEEEEEELEAEWERRERGEETAEGVERKGGRWVKREVELKDGPRQFGYCVDGLEARIRVERR